MEEIVEVLLDITDKLDQSDISYMISGSIAANIYAEPRFTNDIDIVIQIPKIKKGELIALFDKEYYVSDAAVNDAFARLGTFNIIQNKWFIKCDLILLKDDPFSQSSFNRRYKETVLGRLIWFISPEDLILQKILWQQDLPSDVQIRDVMKLVESQKIKLDKRYLSEWAENLNLTDTLKKYL